MSKVQYIVLVAYDNVSCCDRCENNMVCVAICDTRKEARDIEKDEDVYVPIDQHYMIPNDGDWYELTLEDGRTIQIIERMALWKQELIPVMIGIY